MLAGADAVAQDFVQAGEGLIDGFDLATHDGGDLGTIPLLEVAEAEQLAIVGGDLGDAVLERLTPRLGGAGFRPLGGEYGEHFIAETDVAAIARAQDVDGAIFSGQSRPIHEMGRRLKGLCPCHGFDANFLKHILRQMKIPGHTGNERRERHALGEQGGGGGFGGEHKGLGITAEIPDLDMRW